MTILVSILGILLTIFFVIGTHESAHFFTARLLGVKVIRFSIGFGKALFRWHDKKGTEYVLALIPLGGYVKMLDENEEAVAADQLPFAYNRQPFYKKFLIVLAGPLVNILSAFCLYWVIFVIGFVTIKPIIGNITPRTIAAEAGLKANQEITGVDHRNITSWTGVLFRVMAHIGNRDSVSIQTEDLSDKKKDSFTLDLSNWHMNELNPDPLASLGIVPYEPNVPLIIGSISPKSPAATSQLAIGDKIIALNKADMKNWNDIITTIYNHPNAAMMMTVERSGNRINIPVVIGSQRDLFFHQHGLLGIAPSFHWPNELTRKIQYGPHRRYFACME